MTRTTRHVSLEESQPVENRNLTWTIWPSTVELLRGTVELAIESIIADAGGVVDFDYCCK